jgi:hypothetical protein
MAECARYGELIVDDLAGELDEARQAELACHVETCAGCRVARDESRRVIELYRELPAGEPSAVVEARVRELVYRDDPFAASASFGIAPPARRSRAPWLALAAGLVFALGAGLGYLLHTLRAGAEQDQLLIEATAREDAAKREAEATYEAATAAAAEALRVAEQAATEAARLEGAIDEREALARARKLADEAEQAKAKASAAMKGAAGKNAAAGAGKQATGKAGGGKKKGLADDPLGADYEL